MSVGEVVGLVLTAGLFGGGVGAVVTAWGTGRWRRTAQERAALRDAYARWLAGHMTMSRVSVSFVMASRSLAGAARGSAFYSLRIEEVQRARADWCNAMRELDLAEASLRTHLLPQEIREQLAGIERIAPKTVRAAINGSERDVDQFAQALRAADQAVIEFVENALDKIDTPSGPSALRVLAGNIGAYFEAIADRWGKP